MDVSTGRIFKDKESALAAGALRENLVEISPPDFSVLHNPTYDKYAPCFCGSGKKFKFCCMKKPQPNGLLG